MQLQITTFFAGWAGLGRFWTIVVGLTATLAAGLQIAGPPHHASPIDPAGLAGSVGARGPARLLRPSVGLLVGGIGMSFADSASAIEGLPAAVTLAVAPNGASTGNLLPRITAGGHEFLVALPMEPRGFPMDDPDSAIALMSALSDSDSAARLRTILMHIPGAAGLTNAAGPLLGERLMAAPDLFGAVQQEAVGHGLYFLEAGAQALAMRGRQADIVLDADPLTAAVLRERLNRLTKIALDKGSAVGIITLPRPMALEQATAWSRSLGAKGVDLVPVSALVSF